MRQASTRRRLRGAGVVAIALGFLLALFAVPASAATATSITVWVEPPTVLEPYTPATFRAAVTPSNATGTVNFYFDGQIFGTATVVGGQASFDSANHPVGTHDLRAAFIPTPGSDFAQSSSAPVAVVVNDIARVILVRADGSLVPPGSELRVGDRITVTALGFPANTQVSFRLASRWDVGDLTTNASGNGALTYTLPRDLPSAVYLLSGGGGLKSAGFVFYVYNPPPVAPTPGPTTTGSVIAPVVVTVPSSPAATTGTAPSTGGSAPAVPGLAGTGAEPAPLLLGALIFLSAGSSLLAVARPAPAGRHTRG